MATISQTQTSGTQSGNVNFILLAKISNARIISTILGTLTVGEKLEYAYVVMDAKGIRFTVEHRNKSVQANTFIGAHLFQEYNFKSNSDREEFSIPIWIFLECLKIYGDNSSTSLQMAYRGPGTPLVLMLQEEHDVLTDCGITAVEGPLPAEFHLRNSEILSKIVMKSPSLRDAFNELDWSNEHLTWEISPEAPHFRLKARGTGTLCQVDYPRESEIFETFECAQPIKRDYRMKFLHPSLKALDIASKTQIRVNAVGLLSLQHMISTDDGNYAFVDFFIVPKEEGDEDSE